MLSLVIGILSCLNKICANYQPTFLNMVIHGDINSSNLGQHMNIIKCHKVISNALKGVENEHR